MDQRPNPDQLLKHVQADEESAGRGRLKLFTRAGAEEQLQPPAPGGFLIRLDVLEKLVRVGSLIHSTPLLISYPAGSTPSSVLRHLRGAHPKRPKTVFPYFRG